ncbi:MAG: PHD/YefM family antitoxin component YafN of YafNO toxin-antitoxin module [Oleiphilaceae bacterium]|jgi:PHD/YefM family antitoxin component YafN of YafNO toxin-antitoxin module
MHTETVTFLKKNANKLNVDEPLMVTQNGKAKYIIQSFEDYQYQQESIALLKLVNLAEKSVSEEELSTSDAFDID